MFTLGFEGNYFRLFGLKQPVKETVNQFLKQLPPEGITKSNVWSVSHYGRLRWKIENEGFNTQKNGGYNLQHKYAEKDFNAMQNYYQLLQIGHLINQLTEKLQKVATKLKETGRALMAIWGDVVASMLKEHFFFDDMAKTFRGLKQLRYQSLWAERNPTH